MLTWGWGEGILSLEAGKTPTMRAKDAVTVTAYRDGPLLVRGPCELVGADGQPRERRSRPLALCRCGKSRLLPLCDGTHKLVGFRAPGSSGIVE